jgi:hypothetical protein
VHILSRKLKGQSPEILELYNFRKILQKTLAGHSYILDSYAATAGEIISLFNITLFNDYR